MSSTISYKAIKDFGSTYSYDSHAKKTVSGPYKSTSGKKLFKRLIKKASQPVPKEQGK